MWYLNRNITIISNIYTVRGFSSGIFVSWAALIILSVFFSANGFLKCKQLTRYNNFFFWSLHSVQNENNTTKFRGLICDKKLKYCILLWISWHILFYFSALVCMYLLYKYTFLMFDLIQTEFFLSSYVMIFKISARFCYIILCIFF